VCWQHSGSAAAQSVYPAKAIHFKDANIKVQF
jgi:hypothetical protein